MVDLIVRVPVDVAGQFVGYWKDLRVAEALDQEVDLGDPILSDNFDGAAMAAWIIPVATAVGPILGAVFGFLVAKRGELEVQTGDKTIRMKNLKPSQLKEFLAVIDDHS